MATRSLIVQENIECSSYQGEWQKYHQHIYTTQDQNQPQMVTILFQSTLFTNLSTQARDNFSLEDPLFVWNIDRCMGKGTIWYIRRFKNWNKTWLENGNSK